MGGVLSRYTQYIPTFTVDLSNHYSPQWQLPVPQGQSPAYSRRAINFSVPANGGAYNEGVEREGSEKGNEELKQRTSSKILRLTSASNAESPSRTKFAPTQGPFCTAGKRSAEIKIQATHRQMTCRFEMDTFSKSQTAAKMARRLAAHDSVFLWVLRMVVVEISFGS
eukprot:IDg23754t1